MSSLVVSELEKLGPNPFLRDIDTSSLSLADLVRCNLPIFSNGVTPELREYLASTDFRPDNCYDHAIRFIRHAFEGIQKTLPQGSSYLDFGAGEGFSFWVMGRYIDTNVFSGATMYDSVEQDLTHIKRARLRKGCDVSYTIEKPEEQFDFVNMFFVPGIDFGTVEEAASLVKPERYIQILEYDMKDAEDFDIDFDCDTQVEQAAIEKNGFDHFHRRVATYGLSDYRKELDRLGFDVYDEQKIAPKFGVIIGKKR